MSKIGMICSDADEFRPHAVKNMFFADLRIDFAATDALIVLLRILQSSHAR